MMVIVLKQWQCYNKLCTDICCLHYHSLLMFMLLTRSKLIDFVWNYSVNPRLKFAPADVWLLLWLNCTADFIPGQWRIQRVFVSRVPTVVCTRGSGGMPGNFEKSAIMRVILVHSVLFYLQTIKDKNGLYFSGINDLNTSEICMLQIHFWSKYFPSLPRDRQIYI